jgi:hypothetical protein
MKTGNIKLVREEKIPLRTQIKQTLYSPVSDEDVVLFFFRFLD